MKIGLYLENKNFNSVDVSIPEKGNPGMGGTQFNFVTLAYYFSQYNLDYELIIFAQHIDVLPKSVSAVKIIDGSEAVRKSVEMGCEIFIYRPTPSWTEDSNGIINAINQLKIKTIAWEHNFPVYKNVNIISKNNHIKRYVMVSKETYDSMRDHSIINKSAMINNGFDPTPYIQESTDVIKEKYITYLGRIDPDGFIRLMKIWPEVVKALPDVKLKVIGSGRLYNRNEKLGTLNVANEAIEKDILKYVSQDMIQQTIEFLGLLGEEKVPIMQKSRIGIVNPNGKENCPGAAIEFQACQTPVVSAAEWGVLETVEPLKTGLLFTNQTDFKEYIIRLWNDEYLFKQLSSAGPEHIKNKFNYEKITREWAQLFDDIVLEKKQAILPIDQNPNYRYKKFKEQIRRLKKFPPLTFLPSSLFIETVFHKLKLQLSLFKES